MNTSHYPNLELCRKLTEIGFPETEILMDVDSGTPQRQSQSFLWCPSVMEMLDEMPRDIHVGHHQYTWNITPYGFTYAPNQYHSTDKIPFFATDMNDDTACLSIDPNALAEMILWLSENNYISFSK